MVNVGNTDVFLYPRTSLGTLQCVHVFSLPAGVREVLLVTARVSSHAVQVTKPTIKEQMETIELPLLERAEQEQVQALLGRYHTVFSAHEGDLGCTNLLSYDILLLDEAPVRQRYRRIPPSEYELVKSHINQLLPINYFQSITESQVIRESCSPYASPIVLVKKKDGSLRLCVDYCQLNSKTRKDASPLPRIEESLDALTGAGWFSTVDWPVNITRYQSRRRTRLTPQGFCTPFGLSGTECHLGSAMLPQRFSD